MKPSAQQQMIVTIVVIVVSLTLIAMANAGGFAKLWATAERPVVGFTPTNELVSFVSRLTQGVAGTFDADMPLTGVPGIEDRNSDTYLGVATYSQDIDAGCECYYELNGVRTDADQIDGELAFFSFSTLAAFEINLVTINCGGAETLVSFGLAYADIDASGVVSHPDKLLVRLNLGVPLTDDNFRADVNIDGMIDQGDGFR